MTAMANRNTVQKNVATSRMGGGNLSLLCKLKNDQGSRGQLQLPQNVDFQTHPGVKTRGGLGVSERKQEAVFV